MNYPEPTLPGLDDDAVGLTVADDDGITPEAASAALDALLDAAANRRAE